MTRHEELKEYIKDDDLWSVVPEFIDCLYDIRLTSNPNSEMEHIFTESYNYLLNKLEKITKKNNIVDYSKKFIDECYSDLNNFLHNLKEPENSYECKNLRSSIAELLSKSREYIANFAFCFNSEFNSIINEQNNKDTELIQRWWQFFKTLPQITEIRSKYLKIGDELWEKYIESTLKEYKADKPFYNELLNIMDHDKKEFQYRYHGTRYLLGIDNIVKKGLIMLSDNLNKTSKTEFTPEQLLLYTYGNKFDPRGDEGVVIIKIPKDTIYDNDFSTIVKKRKSSNTSYIIPKEYIVGYVDKLNHKVVYGEGYTTDDTLNI